MIHYKRHSQRQNLGHLFRLLVLLPAAVLAWETGRPGALHGADLPAPASPRANLCDEAIDRLVALVGRAAFYSAESGSKRRRVLDAWVRYVNQRHRPDTVFDLFSKKPVPTGVGRLELAVDADETVYVWSDGNNAGVSRWSFGDSLEYHFGPADWPPPR